MATFALALMAAFAPLARAQPTSAQPTEKQLCKQKPWYCGTTRIERERALQLFLEGEELHDHALLAAATTKYRAALERWDHPRIHYYLMLALVKLDKPIEAYEHVVQALRHDADPLEPDEYATALDYQKLLQDKVADVEVVCDHPGAVVTLNGSVLFTGPGRARKHVSPGKYEILARKPGKPDASAVLTLEPGQPVTVKLSLLSDEERRIEARRWSRWKPWVVIATGAGLGALGATLTWRSRADQGVFRDYYALYCDTGCTADQYPAALSDLEQRARRQDMGARVLYGLAGAAVVAGVVAVVVNRPRIIDDPNAPGPVDIQPRRVSLTPIIGPDTRGVSLALTF